MSIQEPFARILGVFFKPTAGTTESKLILPQVHVAEHALAAISRDVLGEEALQIADCHLFSIIPASARMERGPACFVHAKPVASRVQYRMNRRVRSGVNRVADDACLRRAPVTCGDVLIVCKQSECQTLFGQKFLRNSWRQVAEAADTSSGRHADDASN